MADFDLSQTVWCLHHTVAEVSPTQIPPAHTTGANTDVTLKFTRQEPAQYPNLPFSMQGAWYRGEIILDDPHSANLDKTRGQYWAKVFPGTHEDRHGVLIIQENYALPPTPTTNGEAPIRLFTGQYVANDKRFIGHGADNWAWGLFAFTLTEGACAPSLNP